MFRTILILTIATTLAACASTTTDSKSGDTMATKQAEPEMKCVYKKTTDSRIGKKVCTPVKRN